MAACLLLAGLQLAQAWGCGRALLNTQAANLRSQQLYRSLGFRPTGEIIRRLRAQLADIACGSCGARVMMRSEPTLLRRLRVVLVLVVILIASGTTGYMLLEGWSLHDALYMTVITLSTVGYGEVRPLTRPGELFTILMIFGGVGVLAYSFSTVTDYIVAGELQGYLRRRRTERTITRMQEQTIICGYGRVGRQVVEELHANNVQMVVIDNDHGLATELEHLGIPFVPGDASDDPVLIQAGLERAAGLCVCLPATPPMSSSCSAPAKNVPTSSSLLAATSQRTRRSCVLLAPTR
jgi:voltage-gated potassium channel